jgi:gamma-glutamylcyclotransferase (GGCT)/AIG2-like uncharacterized protein YtfP
MRDSGRNPEAECAGPAVRTGRGGGSGDLFVYGSLLFPEVLEALLDRVPDSSPAVAVGWRAAALPGCAYPGLVPGRGGAGGLLLHSLTPAEWLVLDAFEGDPYHRRRLDFGGGRRGWAYVWTDVSAVCSRDWDRDRFARTELISFARWSLAWRREYQAAADPRLRA